ncbi:hypothetical protein OH687_20255 [Burkholderia anthina]|nr:hypothetical protein OH687_20255 [Burkholderia anthina]
MIANSAARSPPRYLFFWSASCKGRPSVARYFGKLNGRSLCCFKVWHPDENPAK